MTSYDQVSDKQKSFILSLLYQVSANVSVRTSETEWIAELNSLCNLNIASLSELSRKEASQVIDQLKTLQ